jgi:phage-related protein
MGSSKKDLADLPKEVEDEVGHNLYEAQQGKMPGDGKVLRGFGSAKVIEIVVDHDSDAYRAVYTVEFEEAIYVLHCFQKKSKEGVKTPKQDKELIDRRLKAAKAEHEKWLKQQASTKKK